MLVASEILILSLFGGMALFCFIMGVAPLFVRLVRRFVERWG
jgi:hypothetical protein